MRDAGGALQWLLPDHLGSTSITAGGDPVARSGELRYAPWGETRYEWGATPTKRRFTGQSQESDLGLYFCNARWYDATLGRFAQADTIVPQPGNPQDLNRYSYVRNSPLRYSDPTGRYVFEETPDDIFLRPPWEDLPASRSSTVAGRLNIELRLLDEMRKNAASDVTADIRALNAEAERNAGSYEKATPPKVQAYEKWAQQVANEQTWDQKQTVYHEYGKQVHVGSRSFAYDIYANIHYGYVGRAAGFTPLELKGGAGLAQMNDNVIRPLRQGEKPRWGNVGGVASFGDDPRDQVAIQIGMELYDRFGLDVSLQQFYAVFHRRMMALY